MSSAADSDREERFKHLLQPIRCDAIFARSNFHSNICLASMALGVQQYLVDMVEGLSVGMACHTAVTV